MEGLDISLGVRIPSRWVPPLSLRPSRRNAAIRVVPGSKLTPMLPACEKRGQAELHWNFLPSRPKAYWLMADSCWSKRQFFSFCDYLFQKSTEVCHIDTWPLESMKIPKVAAICEQSRWPRLSQPLTKVGWNAVPLESDTFPMAIVVRSS